jgi:hypothetical protein
MHYGSDSLPQIDQKGGVNQSNAGVKEQDTTNTLLPAAAGTFRDAYAGQLPLHPVVETSAGDILPHSISYCSILGEQTATADDDKSRDDVAVDIDQTSHESVPHVSKPVDPSAGPAIIKVCTALGTLPAQQRAATKAIPSTHTILHSSPIASGAIPSEAKRLHLARRASSGERGTHTNLLPTNQQIIQTGSVVIQFRRQLAELMSQLQAVQPHYVRCIKPNTSSEPGAFDQAYVLQQLKCGGIMEAVRVCCAGTWLVVLGVIYQTICY